VSSSRDGVISPDEVAWLRQWIFADGKVDADEKYWLKEFKVLADRVCPEFLALFDECMKSETGPASRGPKVRGVVTGSPKLESPIMADWRKMARAILLADGTIDEREVAAIRKELFADGTIDDNRTGGSCSTCATRPGVVKASFNVLLVEALKSCLLDKGALKPGALSLLRHHIGGGKIDAGKKVFLQHLRAAIARPPADFETYYTQCMAS